LHLHLVTDIYSTVLQSYAFDFQYNLCIIHNACMHCAQYALDISYNAYYNGTLSFQALLKHFKLFETRWRQTERPKDRPTDIVMYRAAIAAKN
jgi:hypothetical protein